LVKTRISSAIIRPLPELDATRIEIPNINAGWRAGQHVRIRILSSGMGWFGWSEMHPFTIASVGASRSSRGGAVSRGGSGAEDGMVLMCKKTGTWTRSLFEMAKLGGYIDGFAGRQIKVWVEGPYGESHCFLRSVGVELMLFVVWDRRAWTHEFCELFCCGDYCRW
jgi:ferric-chelate reductase